VDIEILGTLAVRLNGIPITPTAPKPRQVLALLALRAGQVVSVSDLTEELWGAKPPRSARATLQTYILQLRELIGTALEKSAGDGAEQRRPAKDVLLTVPGGYLLKEDDGASDVKDFERLAGCGYRAMDAGDGPRAARLLREALDLWTGPALAGVQVGPQLRTEVRRLEESRLCALDQRVDADLRLGRHRELLGELTVLVGQHPTHESLCGQFMLALYRSGRRGEALDAYQRLRATLVRTMGLEPSPTLAKLQRSMLMSGPRIPPGRPTTHAPVATVS
jgi:DNA-binding SARP family transcriptional activator